MSYLLALVLASSQPLPENFEHMLDNPSVFASMCGTAAADEVLRIAARPSKKREDESEKAIAALTYMNCVSVVRGVIDAIAMAKEYSLPNGKQVCLDPAVTVGKVLAQTVAIAREDPIGLADSGGTSAALVVIALARMSVCK